MIGQVELAEISSWIAQGGKVNITFKVAVRDEHRRRSRRVRSVDLELGRVKVKFNGWDDFVLKSSEIDEVRYL